MPRWLYPLLLAVPVALIASAARLGDVLVFIFSCLGLIPLAGIIALATERLAEYLGERIGGLLNATFGNAAELIIGIIALSAGLQDVVRASITGSIIGNALLVLGSAMLCGGWRFGTQTFDRASAGQYASLLALTVVGLVLPSIAATLSQGQGPGGQQGALAGLPLHELSLIVALILLFSYLAYIAFSVFGLRAHAAGVHALEADHAGTDDEEADAPDAPVARVAPSGEMERPGRPTRWLRADDEPYDAAVRVEAERQPGKSGAGGQRGSESAGGIVDRVAHMWDTSRWAPVAALAGATVLTAIVAELLVGTIEPLAHSIGLSPFFVGLIVLPIVGNAAEHVSAIRMALVNRMETAMAITAGSSIQVALFVAPVLVLVSPLLGTALDLNFSRLELVIFALIAFLFALVSLDGESTWLEGLQLLAFYLIVAVVAFFIR